MTRARGKFSLVPGKQKMRQGRDDRNTSQLISFLRKSLSGRDCEAASSRFALLTQVKTGKYLVERNFATFCGLKGPGPFSDGETNFQHPSLSDWLE